MMMMRSDPSGCASDTFSEIRLAARRILAVGSLLSIHKRRLPVCYKGERQLLL